MSAPRLPTAKGTVISRPDTQQTASLLASAAGPIHVIDQGMPMIIHTPIRLMLLDDHEFILYGMRHLLADADDIHVLGSYTTSSALMAALRERGGEVDVLVLDYSLSRGEVDGLNLIKALRIRYPQVRQLVLSALHTPATVALALRSGARGFLGKELAPTELLEAVRNLAAGKQYLFPAMAEALRENEVATRGEGDPANGHSASGSHRQLELTAREHEVLRCCLEGLSVTQIADKFSRSIKTISTQKQSAYRKLGIANDNQLFKIRHQLEGGE